MLYMFELIQVARYFSTRQNDRLFLKFIVGMAVVVDTACTMTDCAMIYGVCLVHSTTQDIADIRILSTSCSLPTTVSSIIVLNLNLT